MDDVYDLFNGLRDAMTERTVVFVTTSNPLWAPLLRLGGRLGWRVPDSPRSRHAMVYRTWGG